MNQKMVLEWPRTVYKPWLGNGGRVWGGHRGPGNFASAFLKGGMEAIELLGRGSHKEPTG